MKIHGFVEIMSAATGQRLTRPGQWLAYGLISAAIGLTLVPVQAQVSPQDDRPVPNRSKVMAERSVPSFRQRERLVLEFVQTHHAELAGLLDRLRGMSRSEYEKAIDDLDRVRSNLESVRQRDSKRYQVELQAWKLRSRIDLLTAQMAGDPRPDPDLERQLRDVISAQLDVQVQLQELEVEQLRARLRQVEANLEKNRSNSDELVASRVQNTLRRVHRLRRERGLESEPPRAGSERSGAVSAKAKSKS